MSFLKFVNLRWLQKNQVVKVSPGGLFGASEPRMVRVIRESSWEWRERAANLATNMRAAANAAVNPQIQLRMC